MATLSGITHALERVWTTIRTIHPDVRPALITVHSATKNVRGSFSPLSWIVGHGKLGDEVHVSSTILNEGGASVLQTLLHEAAHSVAVTRGVKEVSRQGRYHNLAFAELAVELGLVVAQHSEIGIVTTDITEQTRATFCNVLRELDECIDAYQKWALDKEKAGKKGKSRLLKATCPSCGRIIRASQKTFDLGVILCQPCLTAFEVEQG